MKHIAIIGAGMAGITAARTLMQAGHKVSVFEKSDGTSGRMSTRDTPFGTFDHGAQYFTVRDARFELALKVASESVCKRWSANAVRVLDEFGHVVAAALPSLESHWVCSPGMNSLVETWARPLENNLHLNTRVTRIERDSIAPKKWQLRCESDDDSQHVFSGFDSVLIAIPAAQADVLLLSSALAANFVKELQKVEVAPCWTLMLAYPQANQPGMSYLGPQWNAARSTHHRIAWVARESSKPGRGRVERWTVQASPTWSTEHLEDDPLRVQAKMIKAFSEVTGIRAAPTHAVMHRWRHAQTIKPLGKSYLWDAKQSIGLCGDWTIGHRVEDAFVSGLELALAVA